MRKFYFNKSVIFLGFTFIFLVSDSLAIINFESVKNSIRKRRYIYYTTCAAVGSVAIGLLGYKVYSKFYAPQFERSNGDEQQEKKDTGKKSLNKDTSKKKKSAKQPQEKKSRDSNIASGESRKRKKTDATEAGEREQLKVPHKVSMPILKVMRRVSIPKGHRRLPARKKK